MIILGIDPGTRITGYGLIRFENGCYKAIDYGCIRPPTSYEAPKRYLAIFEGIEELIEKYKPDAVAVETQFVQHNVKSAMMVGMARGTAIVAAAKRGIDIFEYAPTKAKLAVVGNGRASKEQVQKMVQRLLNLAELPTPEDAADALSLAICHAHSLRGVYK